MIPAIIVIPARYDSTRFPGKPLAPIAGHTMIERTWRIAKNCQYANDVYITTDSTQIAEYARQLGAKVIMTTSDCPTGTDRVAQAITTLGLPDAIVVSLQGDAVLTPPWVIDQLILAMRNNPDIPIATPAVKLTGEHLIEFLAHKKISPSSGTTVVMDKQGRALYFSKTPIPYQREKTPNAIMHRHIGMYAYRADTLQLLQNLPASPLEKVEKLEQLRALENGIAIQVVEVDYQGRSHGSVDTPEDVTLVESIIAREGELIGAF